MVGSYGLFQNLQKAHLIEIVAIRYFFSLYNHVTKIQSIYTSTYTAVFIRT